MTAAIALSNSNCVLAGRVYTQHFTCTIQKILGKVTFNVSVVFNMGLTECKTNKEVV